MFSRLQRSSTQTVVIRPDGEAIHPGVARFLKDELGSKNVRTSVAPDGTILSVTVPRNAFRTALRDSHDLRALIRGSSIEVQEVGSTGFVFKRLSMTHPVSGPVYVREVKAVGLASSGSGDARATAQWLDSMRDRLKDLGEIKIPAVILIGLALGTVWGAFRVKQVAEDLVGAHAEDTKLMQESEKGLEKVVRKRSGLPSLEAGDDGAPATRPSAVQSR